MKIRVIFRIEDTVNSSTHRGERVEPKKHREQVHDLLSRFFRGITIANRIKRVLRVLKIKNNDFSHGFSQLCPFLVLRVVHCQHLTATVNRVSGHGLQERGLTRTQLSNGTEGTRTVCLSIPARVHIDGRVTARGEVIGNQEALIFTQLGLHQRNTDAEVKTSGHLG